MRSSRPFLNFPLRSVIVRLPARAWSRNVRRTLRDPCRRTRATTVAVSDSRKLTFAPWRMPRSDSPVSAGAVVSAAPPPGAGVVPPGGVPEGPTVGAGVGVGAGRRRGSGGRASASGRAGPSARP